MLHQGPELDNADKNHQAYLFLQAYLKIIKHIYILPISHRCKCNQSLYIDSYSLSIKYCLKYGDMTCFK